MGAVPLNAAKRSRVGKRAMSPVRPVTVAATTGPTPKSPGSVYPALTALRAEGLIEPLSGRGKARYRVTSQGEQLLIDQSDALRRIEARTHTVLDADASLQALLAQFTSRITKLGGRIDRSAVERVLDNAAKAIADLEVSNGQ